MGEERRIPLSCLSGDGFLEVELAPMSERASERTNEGPRESDAAAPRSSYPLSVVPASVCHPLVPYLLYYFFHNSLQDISARFHE